MVEVDELLGYLNTWRSSKEIRAHFKMSNSEFYHLIKWCRKGGFIETYAGAGLDPDKTNRTFLHKAL